MGSAGRPVWSCLPVTATKMRATRSPGRSLRNATYPSALQPGTDLSLTDGVASAPTSDGGTQPIARLADIGAFGEIDSGGSIDSAVFLAESAGDGAWVTSLVAVLNDDGAPLVQQPFPLGENVAVVGVTIDDGEITTRVRALGSYDSAAGTIDEITRVSTLDGDALQIEDESTEKVTLESPEDFEFEPTVLDAAAGSQTLPLTLDPRRSDVFFWSASEGQQLALTASSDFDSAILSVQGLSDDATLVDQSAYSTSFDGAVPATQTYSIRVLSVAGDELDVQLSYSLNGRRCAARADTDGRCRRRPTTELAAAVPMSSVTDLGPERLAWPRYLSRPRTTSRRAHPRAASPSSLPIRVWSTPRTATSNSRRRASSRSSSWSARCIAQSSRAASSTNGNCR